MFDLIPKRSNEVNYYNPFREMEAMERAFFNDAFFGDRLAEFKTDVRDNGSEYLLEADLPGFDKKDIRVDLNGDTLTISACRHSQHEEKDKRGNYLRCERSYGSYRREFEVSGIKTDAITAKYENGVLTLALPKKEEALPTTRRLEIQ